MTLTGTVSDVRTAVAAATRDVELLVHSVVVPKPSPEVIQSLL